MRWRYSIRRSRRRGPPPSSRRTCSAAAGSTVRPFCVPRTLVRSRSNGMTVVVDMKTHCKGKESKSRSPASTGIAQLNLYSLSNPCATQVLDRLALWRANRMRHGQSLRAHCCAPASRCCHASGTVAGWSGLPRQILGFDFQVREMDVARMLCRVQCPVRIPGQCGLPGSFLHRHTPFIYLFHRRPEIGQVARGF